MKRILAVSGGSDSMCMLHSEYLKNPNNIMVLHVNYNARPTSKRDESIVEDYCSKRKIEYSSLNVDESLNKKYSNYKNFQDKARNIRYDFFLSNYSEGDIVMIAHNKNDFLESAIMKDKKSKNYFYYGIEGKTILKGMIIERPILSLWKKDILDYCNNNSIDYGIDESNADTKYERNNVRKNLSLKSLDELDLLFEHYEKKNLLIDDRRKESNKLYDTWKKQNFSVTFINSLSHQTSVDLMYLYLNFYAGVINVSSGKIEDSIVFIRKEGNTGKKHRISGDKFIIKLNGFLSLSYK